MAVVEVVEEAYRNVVVDGCVMVMDLVVSAQMVAPMAVIGLRAATERESGRNRGERVPGESLEAT